MTARLLAVVERWHARMWAKDRAKPRYQPPFKSAAVTTRRKP